MIHKNIMDEFTKSHWDEETARLKHIHGKPIWDIGVGVYLLNTLPQPEIFGIVQYIHKNVRSGISVVIHNGLSIYVRKNDKELTMEVGTRGDAVDLYGEDNTKRLDELIKAKLAEDEEKL